MCVCADGPMDEPIHLCIGMYPMHSCPNMYSSVHVQLYTLTPIFIFSRKSMRIGRYYLFGKLWQQHLFSIKNNPFNRKIFFYPGYWRHWRPLEKWSKDKYWHFTPGHMWQTRNPWPFHGFVNVLLIFHQPFLFQLLFEFPNIAFTAAMTVVWKDPA